MVAYELLDIISFITKIIIDTQDFNVKNCSRIASMMLSQDFSTRQQVFLRHAEGISVMSLISREITRVVNSGSGFLLRFHQRDEDTATQ